MIEKFVKEAGKLHASVNQYYDTCLPYEFHIREVLRYAIHFSHLLPQKSNLVVYLACAYHDACEDTRTSYNELKNKIFPKLFEGEILPENEKLFYENAADIVYAVTNEKGKTRKERANAKYYLGIRETKYATFVKLCDRLANTCYSAINESSMLIKYQLEYEEFKTELQQGNVNYHN